ncbi:30S ribosomal protein S9 [Patescibacteria group bacterium]|nr:30S ribosomal protein S9 [Patescibacteria group bacterium]
MPEEKKEEKNPFEGRKYVRALGRRKKSTAVAQLYFKGKGKFIVNKLPIKDYFARADLIDIAKASLEKIGKLDSTDINVRVAGGGKKGQSEATRLAIARALISHNEDLRPQLRAAGFLTVDRRVKERKKPGLKRARRAPQWSKR